MKKTFITLLFLAVALTTVLAGCTGGAANTSSDGGGAETEISMWTFVEMHAKFFEDAAARWNEANPDRRIKLKAEVLPYDDMHNKLLVALQSGVGAPDISDIEIGKFPNYLKGEPQLFDLTDLVEEDRSNFVEARLAIYSKDGKLYGLPTHVGATVMYYNTEILSQAGVNPDDIKTWADFVEAGHKVKDATGKVMITIDTAEANPFLPMVAQRKSDFVDKEGNVTMDSQTNLEILEFLHRLIYEEKIAIVTPGRGAHAEEYYGFMNNGGSASILMPMWYMGRFLEYMPDLKGKIAIRPMPAWDEGGFRSAAIGGTGTVVTKQARNPELAREFLKFAKVSKDAQIKLWTELGFDPPRWDVWDAEELKAENKYTEYFGNNIFEVLQSVKDEIHPFHITTKFPPTMTILNSSVLFKSLEEQSLTPAEALKEGAAELKKSE